MTGRIHPTAIVEADEIGEGTKIWAYAHVMKGASVGRDCNIGDHCFVEGGAELGDGVTLKNGNSVWEGVSLGDGVFVGPQVVFTNDRYPRSSRYTDASGRYGDGDWLVRTRVERGASLGGGSVIVCGVTIGEFAMVAAGAVVTRDIEAHALVRGAPAVGTGWVCNCGTPLDFTEEEATCAVCGRGFIAEPAGITGTDQ